MSSLSKYLFDNYESDISRLNAQYVFLKIAFGYPQVVPPEIDISHVSKAIDLATGTGAWALDFASLPDVRNRNIEIFACDISTTKFPPEEERRAKGIKFFQQDVTQPFPDELLGTFDLVNLVYLCYSLTEEEWKKALKNIHGLLRPGGYLMLREHDLVMYDREHPPPLRSQVLDPAAYMQGPSALANVNRILTGGALQLGFIVGLSHHLPAMLKEASLQVISFRDPLIPFGDYCDFQKGLNGASLSGCKAHTIENYVKLLDMISRSMMKGEGLELAGGIRIVNEEERQALMEEITRSVGEGGWMIVSDWVAMRPIES